MKNLLQKLEVGLAYFFIGIAVFGVVALFITLIPVWFLIERDRKYVTSNSTSTS